MKRVVLVGIILLALVLLHRPILRGLGQYLVVEDELRPTDAIYVLSGNPEDRGQESARLYKAGMAKNVVCLGGEPTAALELYGIKDLTAVQTRKVLLANQVPDSAIRMLPKGSSTFEEFEAIVQDCKEQRWDDITIVSSRFHTRRIHAFFRHKLAFEGIGMCLRGAKEHSFEEDKWWKEETGLMFVNNEFIKMAYYFLKY